MKKKFRTISMNRKELYDEVWSMPVSKVAKKHSLNYIKLCQKLKEEKIPYPSSGYWTKLRLGKDVSGDKAPLPESGSDSIELFLLSYDYVEEEKKIEWTDQILSFLDVQEKEKVMKAVETMKVSEDDEPHPVLQQYEKTIEEYKRNIEKNMFYYGYSSYEIERNSPPFTLEMTDLGRKRLYPILNTLFHTVENLGGSIEAVNLIRIHKDIVRIDFREIPQKAEHMLTEKEQEEKRRYDEYLRTGRGYVSKPQISKYDKEYIGKLSFGYGYGRNGHRIFDTKTRKLEDRLPEMLIAIYEQSEVERIDREEREKWERWREERRQKQEAISKRNKAEVEATKKLLNEINDYRIACEIRNYIKVNIEILGDNLREEWIEWANGKADWYDPIVDKEDPIFGKRKHERSAKEKDLNQYLNPYPSYYGFEDDDFPLSTPHDERREFFRMRELFKKQLR